MSSENLPQTFDVIVVGAGSGGLNVAGFMNRAGFSVLLVEKSEQTVGGDCLNYGCVPSKALLHAANTVWRAREADAFGIYAKGVPDIRDVTGFIRERQSIIREHENADYFRSQGMTVVIGPARFVDGHTIAVNGEQYRAKNIVLATGSRPRELDIPGIENATRFTNETIWNIDYIPNSFVFIGGGPINFELGQAFARLGSAVTIVERGDSLLPKEDPDVVEPLIRRMESEGVTFYTNASAQAVNRKSLVVDTAAGERRIPFDALFTGIGRVPNTDGLLLENAGIETDADGRLVVNDYLETTNSSVFACGDVASGYQFTHAAELHASTIIKNFFSPWRSPLDTSNMAWVTYTDPSIATFGRSPAQLDATGITYRTVSQPLTNDDRAIIDAYRDGLLKIYIDRKRHVLGGTMVAPNAGELVQELGLAQKHGLRLDDLFAKVYPYPTAARANRTAAGSVLGERLKGWRQKLLHVLYH